MGIERQLEHPEGVEIQFDVTPASWLVESLWPWGGDVGTRVGSVVPEGFEAYVRIFHPASKRSDNEWIEVRWADVAAEVGGQFHPLAQFTRMVGAEGPNDMGRSVGERPRVGYLDGKETSALLGVLRSFTTTADDCWFCLWAGYGFLNEGGAAYLVRMPRWLPRRKPRWMPRWMARRVSRWWRKRVQDKTEVTPPPNLDRAPYVRTQAREYYLYRGPADSVTRFTFGHFDQTPNIWWPQDRAWCVAIEIDFDSTLVGCSRGCADALLATDALETAEVSLEDRMDRGGDLLNPPP